VASSLTWLDFSEQERRKVLDVVELFRERDTRDELGVGVVRDTFADLLFPGTSTLHTRARYALFIPWIYREIERSRVKSQEPWRHARNAELRLIDEVAKSDDGESAIGINARATLKTYASTIYWAALGTWHLRTYPQSQDQYHRWVQSGAARIGMRFGGDAEIEQPGVGGWHPELPDAPESFPRGVSFRLAPYESQYLSERVVMGAPDSLFALLLDRMIDVDAIESPWQLPAATELPRGLAEQLEHASRFSLAINGAPLLYNLMLAELSKRDDWVDDFRQRLSEWSDEVSDRSSELARWDRKGAFWDLVEGAGARVTLQTRRFIDRWLDTVLDGDPETIVSEPSAQRLIRDRERTVKRGRARLKNPQALALWGGNAGTARLTYRWFYVQRIVTDILRGLEASSA
jgi:hypothetical protein